jgi:hypothetical protein
MEWNGKWEKLHKRGLLQRKYKIKKRQQKVYETHEINNKLRKKT